MCNWCKKETIGIPQVSGFELPLVCEHCGTKIEKRLNYKNAKDWAKDWAIHNQQINTDRTDIQSIKEDFIDEMHPMDDRF